MFEYVGYIPVPHWDGERWRPLDHTKSTSGEGSFDGYLEMPWPEGFDPKTLTPPLYEIGAYVRFNWGDGIRQGTIRKIRKRGGAYMKYEGGPLTVAALRYSYAPCYDIYWNGHGRDVYEWNIV